MSLTKKVFPFYQVKAGENLKSICQKFEIDPTYLLLENNISPKQIKEGVILKIGKKL